MGILLPETHPAQIASTLQRTARPLPPLPPGGLVTPWQEVQGDASQPPSNAFYQEALFPFSDLNYGDPFQVWGDCWIWAAAFYAYLGVTHPPVQADLIRYIAFGDTTTNNTKYVIHPTPITSSGYTLNRVNTAGKPATPDLNGGDVCVWYRESSSSGTAYVTAGLILVPF